MTPTIFTLTAVTALVLLAYSIEQLAETFTYDYDNRRAQNDYLDEIGS